jgi:hypothetical protein
LFPTSPTTTNPVSKSPAKIRRADKKEWLIIDLDPAIANHPRSAARSPTASAAFLFCSHSIKDE